MSQADFLYDAVCDSAGLQLSVTILGDRDEVRTQMREDAMTAGLHVRECCSFDEYASGALTSLGDMLQRSMSASYPPVVTYRANAALRFFAVARLFKHPILRLRIFTHDGADAFIVIHKQYSGQPVHLRALVSVFD